MSLLPSSVGVSIVGTLKWLRPLSGRLSLTLLLLAVFTSGISGCGKSPLSLLMGGGPNVAANVQAGKTNSQTVGVSTNSSPSVSLRPNARVDKIDQSTTTNNELPTWVWILSIVLFIAGWVTDTPSTFMRNLFKKTGR